MDREARPFLLTLERVVGAADIGENMTGDDTATILIVDDRDENVLALEVMLSLPGVEIVTARSGAEALRLILKQEFAVILLDVIMPTMDGFETARLIRMREASKRIPIIFLTAGPELEMVSEAYASGAVDFLIKPLNPEIVKAKVSVFVGLYRMTRQIRRQEEALRLAERQRGEAALKESDALYEASFNAAAVGIAHTSFEGRWLRVNPRFCQILGYSQEECLERGFRDVTHPEDLADEMAGLQQLIAGRIGTYHREKRYVHKLGHTIWLDVTGSLVYDHAGKAKHFIAVIEDVTDRRRIDERQRLLAGTGQILLRSLDHRVTIDDVARLVTASFCDWCAIATVDRSAEAGYHLAIAHADHQMSTPLAELGRRLLDTPGFCRSLGGDCAEMLTDLCTRAADIWNLDEGSAGLLKKVGCGSTLIVPLVIREQVLGQIILVSAHPAKRFGASDLATGQELAQRIAMGVEHARLYHEAQEAIRVRDEFLSIASHELRTPLTPLQIHFQRLLGPRRSEAMVAPEQLQRILERCERQVHRLQALIDNLLDVSRISSGRLRLQTETVDLADIVRDVSGRFAEELAAAECQLVLDSVAPVVGQWDRLRLEQVVTNVLGNAIKYGGGKPIEIKVEETPLGGRLRIADHGIGIANGDLARIFQRFQRAVSARSYGGMGLGLYITRQIVDAHCGSIQVESHPGAGSVFVVELPRRAAALARTESGPHHVASA
jgi:PAS domain S-box-containing protein